jgi:hypothetical protein
LIALGTAEFDIDEFSLVLADNGFDKSYYIGL